MFQEEVLKERVADFTYSSVLGAIRRNRRLQVERKDNACGEPQWYESITRFHLERIRHQFQSSRSATGIHPLNSL